MNGRIMIVEDERIVALDLKQSLESFGHEVVAVAASGEQAIAAAARHVPDLILMDIHLQGRTDGTEAALRIRAALHIPVIFLTAYTEEPILQRAEASLPFGYLVKPVEGRELQATVRMALARRRDEERLQLAIDAAALGVWEWDGAGGYFHAGGHIQSIFGIQPTALCDGEAALLNLIHPEDRPAIEASLRGGTPIATTLRVAPDRLPDSAPPRWLDFNARRYRTGPHPDQDRIIGVVRDVTALRQQEEQLQQAAVVFRTTAEGIAILDPQRRIVAINPAFEELTGHGIDAILGRDPTEFLPARRHGDIFYPDLPLAGRDYWSGEITCQRRDGTVFPAWQNICAVQDNEGALLNYVVALSDISAIRRAEAELNHLAFHDPLTGLGNRNMLKNALERELLRAGERYEQVAVFFLDLDGFKLINDTLGHAVGDRILKVIGDRIQGLVRRSDTVIRLGGDEFVVVVPDVGRLEDCASLAEKILAELRAGIDLDSERVLITGSIGIALFPENADNRDDLIKAADNAMYSAKARGRNSYAFFSSRMAEHARARLQVEQGLARALANEELALFYQPVVSLTDARLIGFEALIRWHHPERGLIPPDHFIPVAETCGLIEAIGTWVLRSACAQGRAWRDGGHPALRLAVNVSVVQLRADDFIETLRRILQETGFPPEELELEITESTIQNTEHSKEILGQVRRLGPRISIDDFGTGFSSLSLLKHLPIDRIKIDKAFTRDLPHDPSDAEITRAIVALAKTLNLELIAEGVENADQQAFLLALGCQEGQGYLFSKPLPVEQASELLARSRSPC
ncbi:MAG: EAL domain-containing protein [Rhodocyclaceae bacterium]|jgi:diguanylate cyclase (GGDEF)-like protein/PAS domain S-box-containing protein|nr:EAL domain-containing protein [Rhodocyclaceae bacterium]